MIKFINVPGKEVTIAIDPAKIKYVAAITKNHARIIYNDGFDDNFHFEFFTDCNQFLRKINQILITKEPIEFIRNHICSIDYEIDLIKKLLQKLTVQKKKREASK